MKNSKAPTFDRTLGKTLPRQGLAFSGDGFMPDLSSENGFAHLSEASSTQPELRARFVAGSSSMLPRTGLTLPVQLGQKPDEGAGGAGSFATITALGARG